MLVKLMVSQSKTKEAVDAMTENIFQGEWRLDRNVSVIRVSRQ